MRTVQLKPKVTQFSLILLLLLLLQPSAQAQQTQEDPAIPIVFVHGFAGSTLADSKGDVKWLNAWDALGMKTPSLSLPLSWKNGVQVQDQLWPGELLKNIQVFGVFGVDIYGPWLEALAKLKRPVYQFIYDWRRDPLEVNEEFKIFLEHVSATHSGSKLDVVGHSLGALYAMAAVNRNPELFNQAILVGGPFTGDINAFMDVQEGVPTGLNNQILAADVIFTFPSVFVFLPNKGSRIADKEGKQETIDFYSVKEWETQQFGPFFTTKDPDQLQEMETYLETALAHAKQFRQLLAPRSIEYPKIRIIAGNTVPTRALALRDNLSKRELDFNSFPREMGDGETLVADTLPQTGIPYEVFYSDKSHIHLMDTPVILKLLTDGGGPH